MAEVNLLYIGDMHGRITWTPALTEAAAAASTILIGGDLTQFGTPADAERILEEVSSRCDTVLAIAGNCDSPAIEEHLKSLGVSIHGQGRMLPGGIGVCGVSGSNPTPFSTPLEYTEEELAGFLSQGWAAIREAPVRILLHHAPPHGTSCDRISAGMQVGVVGLREFCEREQPDLVLCGHIHEARGADRIGETQVVNGGMASQGNGVSITVRNTDVTALLL